MSGGSYEYLFTKDADDLVYNRDLDRMAEDVAALGYAEDFARELERLIAVRRLYVIRVTEAMKHLSEPMRAMEWWHSCDTDEDGFKAALEEWREA